MNFSSLGQGTAHKPRSTKTQPSGTPAFSVQKLSITDGRMSISTSAKNVQPYEDVDLTAENVSYGQSFPAARMAASSVRAPIDRPPDSGQRSREAKVIADCGFL
ncbi:MAG: hypothetical protein HY313_09205 [Acidobacteria bacterium]|nr:hypothetical protein [Acidobacteriota bacterium]